ncbi:MAG TPA: glycosyltransferase family 1 protein [Candidatus Saccharimonadia bacterium]|nr:glycosyltransferase family 1 protein [Candidatus Saccharimonadia bacterium]
MTQKKQKFFIDASPLASPRSSGVGHSVHGFITGLISNKDFLERYNLYLVAPIKGMRYVREYNFPNVRYIPIPLLARIWNRLPGTPLMPYMDVLLGKGVYFLTNFRSWPLISSKSITLVHDIAFRLYPDSLTHRHRSFLEHQVALWKARSTVIATVSASAKRDIHEHLGIDNNRIVVLHNGVDTKKFYPRSKEQVEVLRQKYDLPDAYVLYVGNLEPRKNLNRVLQAYLDLPDALRNSHGLVLVGGSSWLGDDLYKKIEKAVASGANIVHPQTYVSDDELPGIYSGASMLAWPALHEGFGMPILEAMACGVPVLTADNSSLPEVAGDAALLVDAESEDEIRAGMERLLTDIKLRVRLIKAGHERVAHFTWADTARQLVKLADQLLGRNAAGVV